MNMESASRLSHHLEQGLGKALESMTGRQFSIAPDRKNTPDSSANSIVWHQVLSASPTAELWFAAPRELWNMAGRVTLEAAGIDEVGDAECRSTWTEICGQAMAGVAAGITADIGREVTAERGAELDAPPDGVEWTTFGIRNQDGEVFRLRAAWSPDVLALLERTAAAEALAAPNTTTVSKTFDLLLDVALPVSVSFGRKSLQIREVLKLNTGSIVELDRLVSEPVDVIVNDCVIARGEVVVVDGNYGVRITHLASREDRLRSGMREAQNRIGGRP
jgi:flagellar motor switch protein FliN/FliY